MNMNSEQNPGLGELLRHLTTLVDRGAEQIYREEGLNYRPRYTPLLRVLSAGECTIGEISTRARITQGAVSQTVKLMKNDGLLSRRAGTDARQTTVSLTPDGIQLLDVLQSHWKITFRAIEILEEELGIPLRTVLSEVIAALERKCFAQRLHEASAESQRVVADNAN